MSDFEYMETRRVQYEGGATFVPVCTTCGRYVKAYKEAKVNDRDEPNAHCKKCGPTKMLFEGFI